jgi:hypothetical protein
VVTLRISPIPKREWVIQGTGKKLSFGMYPTNWVVPSSEEKNYSKWVVPRTEKRNHLGYIW